MTYYPINMADCSNPFKGSAITTYHPSLPYIIQMHCIKLVDNSILLNRLHTAMITVLDIGSNFLFGSNR